MSDYFRLDNLCLIEGPAHEFVGERQPEAQRRDGLDRTLSAEAMDALFLNVKAWIGSRMIRAMDKYNQPPQHVKITVTVELDGEPAR